MVKAISGYVLSLMDEVVEECAKVAEFYDSKNSPCIAGKTNQDFIAEAIRAIKSEGSGR